MHVAICTITMKTITTECIMKEKMIKSNRSKRSKEYN
jgi:hypothetical protein